MREVESAVERPVPVIYVTDLTFARFDPADLFDLAFLVQSPDHELLGVCLTQPEGGGERTVSALGDAARSVPRVIAGASGLFGFLNDAVDPITLVVVGGYSSVTTVFERDRALFRRCVARVFVVGGYANDYGGASTVESRRLPTDPRLELRNPERFTLEGDLRLNDSERNAWAALLTSGEAIIWIPRDICLWRYAASQVLEDGGPLTEFLRRELLCSNLPLAEGNDRYAAASMPVLLSTLPAMLLARRPDPLVWMRLFRAVAMRIGVDGGQIVDLTTTASNPNVYSVVAIDGVALGKLLTGLLRDRPLPGV